MIIPIYLHIFLMNRKMGVRDIFQASLNVFRSICITFAA